MGDGDGWVECALGHRHWGRFGAAGLLVRAGADVVLQHRAPRTHEGDTWGIPGGARDSHEDVVSSALREADEEAAIDAAAVAPVAYSVDDHGGWSYTTVTAAARNPFQPHAANWESTEIRWWAASDVAALSLHPGFARTWPALRDAVAPLTLVVDAANVVGSRPDGWWRDRPGATRRLRDGLAPLVRHGVPSDQLPSGRDAGPHFTLLPRVRLVVEGAARVVADDTWPAAPGWWTSAVQVHAAERDGDTAVLTLAEEAVFAGDHVVVVTADRGLRDRLVSGVVTASPSWLHGRLADTGLGTDANTATRAALDRA
jgi:8-oxo-dGTP diphosphatase